VRVMEKDFRPFHVKVQCMQLKKLSFCVPLARAGIFILHCGLHCIDGKIKQACPHIVNHCIPLL